MKYYLLVFCLALFCINSVQAEGSKELAPNGSIDVNGNNTTDVAALYLNHDEYNNFGSYDAPNPFSRLNIRINDPNAECILFGFSKGHLNETSTTPTEVTFEFRIKDPAGNIIYGPIIVNPGDANILSWNEGVTGPKQIFGGSGYDAMELSSSDLTSGGWNDAGDYYMEFRNIDNSLSPFLIDFWDFTVTDCGTLPSSATKGRVWSYNWALFAINDFGFPNRPFNGQFYVCAPDPDNDDAAFVTKISFNGSGFKPAAFNIAFNSFGSQNTGDIGEDRKSVQLLNATQAEYQIFLNDPVDVCQTAEVGTIDFLGLTRCDLSSLCIQVAADKAGVVEVVVDLDGNDDIYTPGTADLMFTIIIEESDVGTPFCIDWDGLDGLGNPVEENVNTQIPILITYAQGIYNFPIYDAEFLENGFLIEAIRPPGPFPLAFYDDSNITVLSGSGEPVVQLAGCNIPCHKWNNYTDGAVVGFGNLNTINTWWFSQQIIQKNVFTLPALLECSIQGPSELCEGNTAALAVVTSTSPVGVDAPSIISTTWSGPGIIGSNKTEIIEIDADGFYEIEVEWQTETGDTCRSFCEFIVAPLSNSAETIDTLIILGDVIDINGEMYAEAGTYEQNITAANGCDSLLTINVEMIQFIIHYDLDACEAYPIEGTEMDYTEFTAAYPEPLSCAEVTAGILHRENPTENKHSCTPGVDNSTAMCVGSFDNCTYDDNTDKSIVFEVNVNPEQDTAVAISSLSFYERSPEMFDWIDGLSGPNNYPTLYTVRVLKNGIEIFRQEDIQTSLDWSFEEFDFTGNSDFVVDEPTNFQFELIGYCLVGNGELVNAWDIDEVNIQAHCTSTSNVMGSISGKVQNLQAEPISGVAVLLSEKTNFEFPILDFTGDSGLYAFDNLPHGQNYFIKPIKDHDYLNGVSTLDLVMIQRHILSIKSFDDPAQMIAADINNSQSITALDISLLRKMILGQLEEFPNNTSWRFAQPSESITLDEPWNITDQLDLINFNGPSIVSTFNGIKIGDVNYNASNSKKAIAKSRNPLKIEFENQYVEAGKSYVISFYTNLPDPMVGLQLAINLEGASVENLQSINLDITGQYQLSKQNSTIHLSWLNANGILTQSDDILFQIELKPERSGYLKDIIQVDETIKAEIYIGDNLDIYPIEIGARDLVTSNTLDFNWELSPNPSVTKSYVQFQLENADGIQITVSDVQGKQIYQFSQNFEIGNHAVELDVNTLGLSEGLFLVTLQSSNSLATKKWIIQ